MAQIEVTRDVLIEDAVFILQCLRQNQRGGRSNALIEVRQTLANSVTLDLSDYVAFLRRFGYVDVDALAVSLQLTKAGDEAAIGETRARVADNVGEHFGQILAQGRLEVDDVEEPSALDDLMRSAGLEPATVVKRALLLPELAAEGGTDPGAPASADLPAQLMVHAARLEPTEGELGQGALARVRSARQGELGRAVAVKQWKALQHLLPWLTPAELGARVLTEARAQAALEHPCVMPILEVRTTSAGGPSVILPIALGGSLRKRLAHKLPLADALRTAAQVASALSHAHGAGLTHTAIRAENVLFDARGNALVSDFGTLRLVAPPAAQAGERAPRVSIDLGDSAYRAPELSSGAAFEPAADAYAFGVLVYELLLGQAPGRRSPAPSLVRAEVPREVDDLVDALLDDDAARRPTLAAASARLALVMGTLPLYLL